MVNKRDLKVLSNSLELLNDLLQVVCDEKFRTKHMRDKNYTETSLKADKDAFYNQVMDVLNNWELSPTDRAGHHRDELDDIKAFVKDDIEWTKW